MPSGRKQQNVVFLLIMSAGLILFPAEASETTTFTYDDLGRLIISSNSGGPRAGKAVSARYDPAGNRETLAVGQPLPTQVNAAQFVISAGTTTNEGSNATFTVTKAGISSADLTVNYMTVNGTASAPGDFAVTSGTLTFRPWETVRTKTVPIMDDGLVEGTEQFSMSLSGASSGSSVSVATATATINPSGPANQPPIANSDNVTVTVCLNSASLNVLSNDSDPEGGALTLVAVSYGPGIQVSWAANGFVLVSSSVAGAFQATYVVRDPAGATSTGLIAITAEDNGSCN